MIDKVPDTFERVGYDLNDHAIHAAIGVRDFIDDFPENVSKDEYLLLRGSKPKLQ